MPIHGLVVAARSSVESPMDDWGNLFLHLARLENAKTYPVGDNGNGQNNGADGDDPDP